MDIRPIDANALYDDAIDKLGEGEVLYGFSTSDIDNAPTLSLNALRDEIYQDAVEHGLWERKDYPSDCAWAIKEEARELCDAGNDWEDNGWYEGEENEAFSEELADVVIMCFSVAGKLGIDIDKAIRKKMEINKTRPWKHGKE